MRASLCRPCAITSESWRCRTSTSIRRSEAFSAHAIVAIIPQFPGHGKRVGRAVADIAPVKRVTVVDADVDIRDPSHVDWALNSRFSPQRDTSLSTMSTCLSRSIPRYVTRGAMSRGSKIILDATEKIDAGTFSLPPKDRMMRALDVWHECGLPEFEIPRRVKLRIAKS